MGDERLVQICGEIYAKHKKALDLIFENRPDRASEVADIPSIHRVTIDRRLEGKREKLSGIL